MSAKKIEPVRLISLRWDDPWEKYEQRTKLGPRGEQAELVTDIRVSRKKPRGRHSCDFKNMRVFLAVAPANQKNVSAPDPSTDKPRN